MAQIPLKRKLLFSAIGLGVFFGSFELLCRVAWTPPAYKRPIVGERKFVTWLSGLSTTDPLAGPLYREDRYLLWKLIPDVEFTLAWFPTIVLTDIVEVESIPTYAPPPSNPTATLPASRLLSRANEPKNTATPPPLKSA